MQDHHYDERIAALRRQLETCGCDAFFSVDPADNAYLTGFFGSTSAVLVTPDTARLLCDFRYQEQAASLNSGIEVVTCSGNLDARLGEHLRDSGAPRAAFDPGAITVARHDTVKTAFTGETVTTAEMCRKLREIKEPSEVERVRAASQLAEAALEQVLSSLKCGMCEYELAASLEYEFRKRGAQRASFDTIVLFGARSSLPHGMPGPNPLKTGDIVLIDCGCVLDGYCSDLTRTFVFGRIPGDWFADIYECVRQAQDNALKAVASGVSARSVDDAARAFIAAAGHGDHFGHGTGHGVGLEIHESPRLSALSEAVLHAGMVVTVEPGIYLPGQGGVRIEDLLVVTENGCDVLTETPKELRILQV
jgi:Xaa-Pro aminopeptidase